MGGGEGVAGCEGAGEQNLQTHRVVILQTYSPSGWPAGLPCERAEKIPKLTHTASGGGSFGLFTARLLIMALGGAVRPAILPDRRRLAKMLAG